MDALEGFLSFRGLFNHLTLEVPSLEFGLLRQRKE
jgi:hypothetical protein